MKRHSNEIQTQSDANRARKTRRKSEHVGPQSGSFVNWPGQALNICHTHTLAHAHGTHIHSHIHWTNTTHAQALRGGYVTVAWSITRALFRYVNINEC